MTIEQKKNRITDEQNNRETEKVGFESSNRLLAQYLFRLNIYRFVCFSV